MIKFDSLEADEFDEVCRACPNLQQLGCQFEGDIFSFAEGVLRYNMFVVRLLFYSLCYLGLYNS